MYKLLLWWYARRQARADVTYWKGQAEKWERKYDAAIQVRDQLSAQLDKTPAAWFKGVSEDEIKAQISWIDRIYPDIKRRPPFEQVTAMKGLLCWGMRDKDNDTG